MRRIFRTMAVVAVTALVAPLGLVGPADAAGSGDVLAWGNDDAGQIGDGGVAQDRDTPVVVVGAGSGLVAVSAGDAHSLALRPDSTVLAWGSDRFGQLGDSADFTDRHTPVPVSAPWSTGAIAAVDAGGQHSLALGVGGDLYGWGKNDFGQAGLDRDPVRPIPRPLTVTSGAVVAVSAGGNHNLALRAHDGGVVTWGANYAGQLGNGTFETFRGPVIVSGLGVGSGVVAVSAGGDHSLALRADGSVLAWGSDSAGQLGDANEGDQSVPVPVRGLGAGSGVVAVSAGDRHNLALRSDGSVVAWGEGVHGQLGNDLAATNGGPVQVSHLGPGSGVVGLSAGGTHSLAVRSDGSVLAWGSDVEGQLGEVGSAPGGRRAAPVPVSGLGAGSGVLQVSAGGGHSLAVSTRSQGYALVTDAGAVLSTGSAGFFGSTSGIPLNRPIVGIEYTATARGYWLVASDGGIFAFGDAMFFGSTGGIPLNRPIVGMERTPSGNGYWLVASDGGIFAYGDARFFGSTGGIPLNQPVVGMERTPTGDGYWLVASDGGTFAFGAAGFYGSTGGRPITTPVVAMSRAHTGRGYHLVLADGTVFGFRDAIHRGSPPPGTLTSPIVGIMPTPDGAGYWLCARNGGVFPFGNAQPKGSTGPTGLGRPVVACDAPLNLSG